MAIISAQGFNKVEIRSQPDWGSHLGVKVLFPAHMMMAEMLLEHCCGAHFSAGCQSGATPGSETHSAFLPVWLPPPSKPEAENLPHVECFSLRSCFLQKKPGSF